MGKRSSLNWLQNGFFTAPIYFPHSPTSKVTPKRQPRGRGARALSANDSESSLQEGIALGHPSPPRLSQDWRKELPILTLPSDWQSLLQFVSSSQARSRWTPALRPNTQSTAFSPRSSNLLQRPKTRCFHL